MNRLRPGTVPSVRLAAAALFVAASVVVAAGGQTPASASALSEPAGSAEPASSEQESSSAQPAPSGQPPSSEQPTSAERRALSEQPDPQTRPDAQGQAPPTGEPEAPPDGVLPGIEQKVEEVVEDAVGLVEEHPRRLIDTVERVWSFELISSEDHPLTVGMLVGALIVFLLGGLAARIASRWLGRRLLPRFGLEQGAAAALQTLAFYALLVMFALFAMQWAGIPLTVFTVAGGALAIGVGFGSQNIVNNFISGLILMAERPIKVGDLIDVDGTQGTVERIGARSTRIMSGDNTHIIIPNSSFLEKNVINWTLADRIIRSSFDVGVAYGSPTARVRELMLQAIGEQGDVLPEPAPEVLFMDFGDNSLVFRGLFWIRIERPLSRFRVQSAIRYRIDELFRDAGITIAFPQRDVHLDSLKPIEVRLTAPPAGTEDGSKG